MNEFKHARDEYESTPIPEELDSRVRAGIRQGEMGSRTKRHGFRWGIGVAAACMVMVGGLNVSPTFAAAASDVPVLGGLFQILTVRNYDAEDGQVNQHVSVPEVDAEGDLAQQVNAEIQERVDALLAQAQQVWEDYHDAFIATGGTEDEWSQREMNVDVNYEIKSQTDTTVSFVVTMTQDMFDAYNEQTYYNLDIAADKDITLADVLGEDWVNICNAAVQTYIDQDTTGLFFSADEGGFTTVDEATSFYLNEDGSVTLVFPEYTIAAGAAGIVEIPVAG